MKNPEGYQVGISYTAQPANVVYHEPAWWAYTVGRIPDIEVAGPCATKKELMAALKQIRRRQGDER